MIPIIISFLQLGKLFLYPQTMPLLIQDGLKFQRASLFGPKGCFTLKCKSGSSHQQIWMNLSYSTEVGVWAEGHQARKGGAGRGRGIDRGSKGSRKGHWDRCWHICQLLSFPKSWSYTGHPSRGLSLSRTWVSSYPSTMEIRIGHQGSRWRQVWRMLGCAARTPLQ